MNYTKRNFSVVMNLISVLFVIISIGSVTSNGRNTFYKTISFIKKPFIMTIKMYQDGMRLSYTFFKCLIFHWTNISHNICYKIL